MRQRPLKYSDLTVEQKVFFLSYVHNNVRVREFPLDINGFTFEMQNIIHDFEYWRGGKEWDRRKSDIKFLFGCIRETFRSIKLRYWLRFMIGIFGYFLALRAFGKFSFCYFKRPAYTWSEFVSGCGCVFNEVKH